MSRSRLASCESDEPAGFLPRTCHVYVVLLHRPDGRIGFYVGQSALTPEERFAQHKAGVRSSRHVRKYGVHLMPELYARYNPLTREEAATLERAIAERLRQQGCWVEGGH
ncbi:MAG TPA: hypothetical protein VM737_10640 [Gemmatimonadota bacterium]|nr:hypothetical protein [Gemmatimonadota bacterium]